MLIKKTSASAFTLIELSIVLIIIGLIVGGVLVGRDLISAAGVRSQVAQIDSFQAAANTFRGKYGYLPGDIPPIEVAKFGLLDRGSYANGNSDGNGAITGILQYAGEPLWFWIDLSSAKLIAGAFSGDPSGYFGTAYPDTTITSTMLGSWLPQAKLDSALYTYVYNYDYARTGAANPETNYFGLARILQLLPVNNGSYLYSYDTIPVTQAYSIDKKIDDGLPQHGKVLAGYINGGSFLWAGHDWYSTGIMSVDGTPRDDYPNWPGDETSCYHNPTSDAVPMQYAFTTNGNRPNCALSFRF